MIAVVDYGAGNIFSVLNALTFLKQPFIVAENESQLQACEKIILPGVGAFPDAVNNLKKRGLFEPLKIHGRQKPFFGICLGMQLLFDKGTEFCETEGLGLIDGTVELMEVPYKIPHMGWNSLIIDQKDCPLLKDVKENSYMYFVHSYMAKTDSKNIAAHCDYGATVPALVCSGNIYGAQFHPEKSGGTGIKILSNFCNLVTSK